MEKSSLGLENFGHRWSDNLGSNCEHIVTASGSSFSSAHNYGEFMILKYLFCITSTITITITGTIGKAWQYGINQVPWSCSLTLPLVGYYVHYYVHLNQECFMRF